ncbi:MAG: adenylate/guanylate cyclase domain-containing protein [Bacteroidota bacterium]|nr:adenylate/guanylate cyclase domain-containing protein [Bacteroidota bacterium]
MTPWIQEINLPSQYSEIPNETFYRDSHGTMFIGKNNGLSIISGKQIRHFHMNGPVYVTGNGSDTLYYVSEDDLGFLIKENGASYHTVSRKHLLPTLHRNFNPQGIQNRSGNIFIYTDIGLFLFSRSEIRFLDDQEHLTELPVDTVRNRELLALIEDEIGIPANGIKQIFIWKNTEIWILGAYTLHQFHDPSPLKLLETGSVNTGRILKSMVSKDQILLGTSRGIFAISKDPANGGQWSIANLLPKSRHSVHIFSAINGQVFAAGSDGLYLVSGKHAEVIDKGSFTGIQGIRKGFLIASGEEGTVSYKLDKTGWISTTIDPTIQNAHSFISYKNKLFFLCNNGVFRSNNKADRINPIPFHSEELLYKLIQVEKDLLLVSDQQVYRYDINEEIFQPLPTSHRSRLLSESDMIVPAKNGRYWILQNSGNYLSRVLYTSSLDEPATTYTAFPVLPYLGEVIDMAYADSVLFLTGKDKISLFDLHFLKAEPFQISVSQLEYEPTDHKHRFHFSGLELQRLPEPVFRYRTRPGNTSWSRWSSSRDYTVSGLNHGKYSIEVQAMDLYGRIIEAEQLSFAVAPPFYKTWYAYLVYGILFLIALFLFRKWRLLSYQRAESRVAERMELKIQSLAAEKERSDQLVAEVLPEETANQLRSKGKAKWDKYERTTVLFSDIQGFTRIAEEMNPEKLIDELDQFFFHFDSVVDKYNIEKIKTIGDAYMAAGGIPDKNSTNPVEVVLAALEMQSYMQQLKSSKAEIWDLRIGIHTGPVIAGVVGHKKMSYDIWGDTVNTASRMESSGTPGKINISGITYGMVKDYFICEYRGKLPVKYKGNIDMYYVNGLRPELSVDLKGIPNKRFFIKLQLLRLGDLEEKVFEGILLALPENLHFHGSEYARKVYNQSFLLCRSEEIEQEDRLLVRTAALMLYTGFTQDYHNFQNRSSVISREILPDYKYSDRQIDQICNLILATKRPFNPNNRLEKILIDAKMEFIGRPDYSDQIKLLFQEIKENGSKINGQQFKKQQLELLFDFQFYTVAAQRMREVSGSDQMTTLEQERWI